MAHLSVRPKSGSSGHIRTLTLDAVLSLFPSEPSEPENTPHFHVHLSDKDRPEVGGWKPTHDETGE